MSQLRVLPLGPPGAGKGTQSRKIADRYDIPHVATGDMLRENKEMDTEHGTPGEYMDAGELVPDPVMEAVVEEALSSLDGFILDGYPRTVRQARHLETVTELDAIIHLEVPREELVRRLTGRRVDPETSRNYHIDFNMPDDPSVRDRLVQREDDAPAKVERRLDVFDEQTKPVIEHYRNHDAFVRIDGDATPEEVWESITDILDPIAGGEPRVERS